MVNNANDSVSAIEYCVEARAQNPVYDSANRDRDTLTNAIPIEASISLTSPNKATNVDARHKRQDERAKANRR